jgi:hypothetical protein
MTLRLSTSIVVLGLATTLLAFSPADAYAQHDGHEGDADPPSLSGAWNLSLSGGDHVVPVGLELTQDGTKLTGTLMLMGNEVPIEGEFADGKLSLACKAKVMDRSGHETDLKITGVLKEDGTLAGELTSPHGELQWTAERLKKRK